MHVGMPPTLPEGRPRPLQARFSSSRVGPRTSVGNEVPVAAASLRPANAWTNYLVSVYHNM
jgi:hypothetical protein